MKDSITVPIFLFNFDTYLFLSMSWKCPPIQFQKSAHLTFKLQFMMFIKSLLPHKIRKSLQKLAFGEHFCCSTAVIGSVPSTLCVHAKVEHSCACVMCAYICKLMAHVGTPGNCRPYLYMVNNELLIYLNRGND